jgi:alkylation response protein AidB-like acyl-CoA dehydrogenase
MTTTTTTHTRPAQTAASSTTSAARSVAGIRQAIAPVLAQLAATARAREGTRNYPFEEVRALAQHGIALIGIPLQDGGAGGTLRDVTEVVIELARADSNVAQALRVTFLTAYRASFAQDGEQRAQTLARLLQGGIFAGSGNERSGGANGSIHATLRRAGDGYVLKGTKYYSTGGLFADWFGGTALDEAGRVVRFTVPTDRAGVERVDDFDAIGQRLTASGSTELHDVRVYADELVWADEIKPLTPWPGSAPQLYLATVEAGIAAAALDDAIWFAREKARPIKHSTAQRSLEDPYVRHAAGEIGARAQIARASVLIAAETLERVRHAPAAELRQVAAHAAVVVAQAQYAAVESALRAAELLFDIGGGQATDREFAFDRHWRNARTVANQNPRAWKAAVAGNYHLAGEEPPTSGLF